MLNAVSPWFNFYPPLTLLMALKPMEIPDIIDDDEALYVCSQWVVLQFDLLKMAFFNFFYADFVI